MNDLLRPSLYSAEHPIVPCRDEGRALRTVDVVGPVCESGDFLARSRALPEVRKGERIAVLGAGAYGSSMASCYNTRRRPAEVLVDGANSRLIRRRETFEELWAGEEPVEETP
jgi:diaminopimelate decarboxylase